MTPTTSDSRQTVLDLAKQPQGSDAAPQNPIVFIRNDGQIDPSVAYHVKAIGQDYFFARDGVRIPVPGPKGGRSRMVSLHPLWFDETAAIVPGQQSPTQFNFYKGQTASDWRTKVPAYASLTYRHGATGIDLVWYARGQELEYDVVLPAGVEPGQARFRVEGARTVRLDKQGALVVETADGGRLIQAPPRLHQVVDGQDIPVKGRFADVRKSADGWSYGFVAAAYDRSRPLVIDPALTFGVPLSGNATETINAVTVGSAGETYVSGTTTSSDLGAVTYSVLLNDAFIAQYDTAGNRIWTSYIGGTKDELGNAMAIIPATATANAGNIVIVGQTNSPSGLPITNDAFNKSLHGTGIDAFLAIVDPTGDLVYCSYFGGSGTDIARGVAVDASGNISMAGSTDSVDLPTTSALYPSRVGGTDGFIAKFNATGAYLRSLTYFGGAGTDTIYAIALDSQGNAYVAGETTSANFPVKNAIIAARPGATSGFVSKINPSGSGLVYSTYLGGKGVDGVRALALDGSRNVYLTGKTTSSDFPVTNALYPTLAGDSDAFAVKLDTSGRFLWYATFLGGGDTDIGLGVAVDQTTGAAYFTGNTDSANFPVVDLLQFSTGVLTYTFGTGLGGSTDAFITKIDAAGSQAVYSNYLGGLGIDEGHGVAVDPSVANVSITVGSTIYSGKPIFPYNPVITPNNARKHGFLAKITDTGSPPANYPMLTLDRPSARSGQQVTLTLNLVNATATGVGALAANLVYDTAVLANPVVTFDPRLTVLKKTAVSQSLGINTLRLSVYSDPASALAPLVITAGAVATVTFDVLNNVASQFNGVTLAPTASTTDGLDIQIGQVNGGVHIRQRCGILGDCDCSGAVELWELQNALNVYLSALSPPFCMVTDYSAIIKASDLTTIINNYAIPPSDAAAADASFTRQADAGASAGLRLGTAEKRADGWYVPVLYTAAKDTPTSAVATRIGYDATAYASVDAIIGPAAKAAGKELLVNAKNPGTLAMMAISTANKASIGDGILAWLRLVPVAGTENPLTALTQAGDASTPQGQAVAVQSTGKAVLAVPAGVGASLGLLLQ
ncbi:DUF7948 domain-containing protein [Desulfovibrio sp. TomC]|uniref:DUF7948 domain-containing protein n=1 Tax=Desulfovibrio sp. TomC TaxID=1562888 RepID=UPI00057506BC|nr:SBBP repeat-containing protein [Desulfovibrio sp. TomC]KHK02421.1 Cell surface protein [Desulfovibrio sp. TomC]